MEDTGYIFPTNKNIREEAPGINLHKLHNVFPKHIFLLYKRSMLSFTYGKVNNNSSRGKELIEDF